MDITNWMRRKWFSIGAYVLLEQACSYSVKSQGKCSYALNCVLLYTAQTFKGSPFWSCVNMTKFNNFMKRQFLVVQTSQVQLNNTQ